MPESTRVTIRVLRDGKARETMGAVLTKDGDLERLRFDKPIHVKDGEDLRIEHGSSMCLEVGLGRCGCQASQSSTAYRKL